MESARLQIATERVRFAVFRFHRPKDFKEGMLKDGPARRARPHPWPARPAGSKLTFAVITNCSIFSPFVVSLEEEQFVPRSRLSRRETTDKTNLAWTDPQQVRKEQSLTRIAVIDGQGGGIGATIIKKIKEIYGERVELWALGTNAIATSQMMKARANRGATGENAICHCAHEVDVIVGPISILISHAMMGEVTPAMVQAVGATKAPKILLPLTQEAILVVGTVHEPLPHLVEKLVNEHLAPYITRENHPACR